MKLNNFVSPFLITLFILACLWGCNGATTPVPPTPTPTQPPLPEVPCDLDGVIKVGFSNDSPSFADVGPQGFDIDLMNHVASSAGFEKEYVERPWATILDDLESGRIAAAIGAIPITPAHAEQADFSAPYFEDGLIVAVQVGSSIQDADDLEERPVAVQQNSNGQSWCQNDTQATCISYADTSKAFEALDGGDVEAVACEKLRVIGVIDDNPQFNVQLLDDGKIVTEKYGYEQYGIAVRQDCPELLQAVNEGLEHAKLGAYQQICQVRFGMVEVCMGDEATPPPTASALPPATEPPSEEAVSVIAPTTLDWETVQRCGIEIASGSQDVGTIYTIKPGDTLSRIAQENYGRPVDYKAIYHYTNQDAATVTIEDPSIIAPGWEIYLPTVEEVENFWAGKTDPLPAITWGDWEPLHAAGSSTVFPLTTRLGECFVAQADQKGYQNRMKIESVGTFGGLETFCAGQADILNASVRITASDLEAYGCDAAELVELQVGTDAVSIVVGRNSSFISKETSITMDELRQILSTAQYWSEVRPEWPEEEIVRFYPSAESGTLQFAADLLFDGNKQALLKAANVTLSEDDAALAEQIESSQYGVGFFGYAYYRDSVEGLLALPVEDKRPQPETVDSPEPYPLVRPLFIYTTPELLAQKPGVAAFVNFYLRSVNDHVVSVGYFPLSESAHEESIRAFSTIVTE